MEFLHIAVVLNGLYYIFLSIQIIQNWCLYARDYGKENMKERIRANKSRGRRCSVIDVLIRIALVNVLWYLFAQALYIHEVKYFCGCGISYMWNIKQCPALLTEMLPEYLLHLFFLPYFFGWNFRWAKRNIYQNDEWIRNENDYELWLEG